MQRVLYVLSRFPSNTTTFTTDEMLALRELGAEIHIATLWQPEAGTKTSAADSELIDRIASLPLSKPHIWLTAMLEILRQPGLLILILRLLAGHAFSPYALMKAMVCIPKGLYLGQWAREHGIEHIHAHFLTTPTTVALLAAAASRIPYSVTIHAFDVFAQSRRDRNGSARLKCERAAVCIVISEFNRRYLLERYPGLKARFEVIYNGVNFDLFTPPDKHPPTGKTILTVGRLIPKKGHDVLLRAIARLRDESIKLNIIGYGGEEAKLRSLAAELGIADRVNFLGAQPLEATVDYYCKADVFALACVVAPDGDMDGLPTVLIEALAMKLPTVSTAVSGVPEIIQDGVTGRCVPSGDVAALADALQWVFDHRDETRKLAEAGCEAVRKKFDRRQNAAKLYDLLQTIHEVEE